MKVRGEVADGHSLESVRDAVNKARGREPRRDDDTSPLLLTLPGLQALALFGTRILLNHAGSHAFSLPGSIRRVQEGVVGPGTRDEVSAMATDGAHV